MAKFSPIELQPGGDMDMIIQSVNNNFRQVAESNRTNVITDENGNDRIIIGKMPDGKYGIIISNEGVNVNDVFVSS